VSSNVSASPESSARRLTVDRVRCALLLAGLVAALVASVTAFAEADQQASHLRAFCGFERWTVKTLQDRPRLLPVEQTTVRFLVTRPAPATLPTTRLPFERHVFRIVARVTLVRQEADGDLHLVLRDGSDQMIAEAPSPGCTARATPRRQRQMEEEREAVRLCRRATVTGVAFFDFKHGQTGVAPNAIELHPLLGFRCSREPGQPAW
jgi:hypothetical protein